jgi:hypothetical protein
LLPGPRSGSFGLLRNLHTIHLLGTDAQLAIKTVKNAAWELRDDPLSDLAVCLLVQDERQARWVDTMIKESAAQSVAVPS